MVWFQCEDCGDNLKKPKLPNHFRICSASKLSCIDCGEIFGQESVEGHTQCITEAEKYGPKGQGKASNVTSAKANGASKQKPDVDINVGLSDRPPWFCSLCNTKATSKQTLLLHAEGKKHRAKARAFHANQQPKNSEETPQKAEGSTENGKSNIVAENVDSPKQKDQSALQQPSDTGNDDLQSNKKRKFESSPVAGSRKSGEGDVIDGEVIQVDKVELDEKCHGSKRSKGDAGEQYRTANFSSSKDGKKKIKWKKLINSALKSCPERTLKLKKLRKIVLKSLADFTGDESQLMDTLTEKINSSSRFTLEGKYVRLVA